MTPDSHNNFLQKYIAIIDRKTGAVLLLCLAITYVCYLYDFHYNLNVTLFSIAVIFPLVFTIREAFKQRDQTAESLQVFA